MLRLTSQMCLIVWVLLCAPRLTTITCCHEIDRSLLLKFKEGVVDPSNRLSSWSTHQQDCCKWEGVGCSCWSSREWEGVGCNSSSTRGVTALFLQSQNDSETLRGEINLYSLLALPFLEALNLEDNDFERISMPSLNNSVATRNTQLLPNSSKLTLLSLSGNINLHIDNLQFWLSLLPSLTFLDLTGIHLPSETNWVQSLASLPLQYLYLQDCNLTTSVLSIQHFNFSSILYLDLGLNDFTAGLPNWLFNLSKQLKSLDLSQCNLRGQISDFSDFRCLSSLNLPNNIFKDSIPDWLGQLSLEELDLSNNSLHGSFPSNLLNSSNIRYLDISFNDFSGTLPKIIGRNWSYYSIGWAVHLQAGVQIYMSSNKFKGWLPRISNAVLFLDLANNSFSGPLSSLLCHTETSPYRLKYLDLSNNDLTQELPSCWNNWTYLSHIFLGNNHLAGRVPSAMGSSLQHLKVLDLHNNGFAGEIPWTFRNSTSLVLLNLEGNNFSESIQTWMPQGLKVLSLRSNQFSGNITPQLCNLANLTILDLANNKLSGSIPPCLSNITRFSLVLDESDLVLPWQNEGQPDIPFSRAFMKIDLHTKGQQLEYQKNLKLVRMIDLSENNLSGEIPTQLFKLTKLQFLNLSHNYLTGKIAEQIGEMKDLESLDFSHNHLYGKIPQSMSGLSFLSVLDLSYNHFNGQIPLGTQLQSFNASSYNGNPELCGPPLQKNCTIPVNPDNREQVEDAFLKSLYVGMGVGFAVGFWLVCGSLFLNRAWRHTYFRFFNSVADQIYVIVAIKFRRLH